MAIRLAHSTSTWRMCADYLLKLTKHSKNWLFNDLSLPFFEKSLFSKLLVTGNYPLHVNIPLKEG